MKYYSVHRAVFERRPNRFIAECVLSGEKVTAHVRNTGRCRELLIPGCTVYLEENDNPGRKTRYTLVCVEKEGRMINMDSLAPNKVFAEGVAGGRIVLPGLGGKPTLLKPEVCYGSSRFDFYIEAGEQRAYAEVKGVTLEENGDVFFPDAPTERGVRHIRECCRAVGEGYLAYLVFIVQMKGVGCLMPNRRTHPAFGDALCEARRQRVALLAYDCEVTPEEIRLADPVEVKAE